MAKVLEVHYVFGVYGNRNSNGNGDPKRIDHCGTVRSYISQQSINRSARETFILRNSKYGPFSVRSQIQNHVKKFESKYFTSPEEASEFLEDIYLKVNNPLFLSDEEFKSILDEYRENKKTNKKKKNTQEEVLDNDSESKESDDTDNPEESTKSKKVKKRNSEDQYKFKSKFDFSKIYKTIDVIIWGRFLAGIESVTSNSSISCADAIGAHKINSLDDFFSQANEISNCDHGGSSFLGTRQKIGLTYYYHTFAVNIEHIYNELRKQNPDCDLNKVSEIINEIVKSYFETNFKTGKTHSGNCSNSVVYAIANVRDKGNATSYLGAFNKPIEYNKDVKEKTISTLRQFHDLRMKSDPYSENVSTVEWEFGSETNDFYGAIKNKVLEILNSDK